jgi:hypothetical protein
LTFPRRIAHITLTALALVVVASVWTLRAPSTAQRQADTLDPAVEGGAIDPVAALAARVESGQATLSFARDRGYLSAVLQALDIPPSSQTLVFSKSSAQMGGISPDKPRALYFNDEAYVGWVDGGGLELAAMDPEGGPYFYTLPQLDEPRPRFERHTTNCIGCHDSSEDVARIIPRLLDLSVVSDRNGVALQGAALVTTDRSPLRERWGGWYVTGTHGTQRHLGNQTFRAPATEFRSLSEFIANLDLSPGANVTDLKPYFDTSRYLTPHSDMVALMVLGHQTHVQNLLVLASYRLAEALKAGSNAPTTDVLKDVGEPLVRALLFSGEAALTAPVAGTSNFAAEFQMRGPRDARGRSLRDLDLRTRLMRYPLSYIIYTKSFDAAPAALKEYVYRRLEAVLSGRDTTEPFAHLTTDDRTQIRSILLETKPDFATAISALR